MQLKLKPTRRLMLRQALIGMTASLSCPYTAGRRGRQPSALESITQAAQRMTQAVWQATRRTQQVLAQTGILSFKRRRTPSQTHSSK